MGTKLRTCLPCLGMFLPCLVAQAAPPPPPALVQVDDAGAVQRTALDTWWVHAGDVPGLRGRGDVLDSTHLRNLWEVATAGRAPGWQELTVPWSVEPTALRGSDEGDVHALWWAISQFSVDANLQGRSLGLVWLGSEAHVQVYINGQLVGTRGALSDGVDMVRSPLPPVFEVPPSLLLTERPNSVAVLLRNPFLRIDVSQVMLEDPRDLPQDVFVNRTAWYIVNGSVVALLLVVLAFFLVWYLNHRDEYENIFLMLSILSSLVVHTITWAPFLPNNGVTVIQLALVAIPMGSFLTVYFQHRYRIHAHRYFVYGVVALVAVALVLALVLRDPRHLVLAMTCFIPVNQMSFLYGLALNMMTLRRGNAEARMVLWGYSIYIACTTADTLLFLVNNRSAAPANSLGAAVLALSIVASLAKRFSGMDAARQQVVMDLQRRQELQEYLVSQIAEAASAIEITSGHILSSASQQQFGATEQSTAVEETRRTMETLLSSGHTITMTAHDVLRNAEMTQQHNHAVAQRIGESSNHSRRISEILDIIRDIANKTELLALNAALEGSRAGEAGRGFALVATQMQRLAENVMSAVADIKDLTLDIRKVSGATQATTLQAAQLASDTTESAHKIGLIIQEQQVGTEQVTRAMDDVAKIAQQTALSGQTTLERTQTLIEKARSLRALVEQYRSSSDGAQASG